MVWCNYLINYVCSIIANFVDVLDVNSLYLLEINAIRITAGVAIPTYRHEILHFKTKMVYEKTFQSATEEDKNENQRGEKGISVFLTIIKFSVHCLPIFSIFVRCVLHLSCILKSKNTEVFYFSFFFGLARCY